MMEHTRRGWTLRKRLHRRQLMSTGLGVAAGLSLAQAGGLAPSAMAQDQGTPTANTANLSQGVLPDHRLLLYYGFPGNENMGILGEYEPEELLTHLEAEAERYRAVDDSRPWKLGLELIASVAQGAPQADNTYVADTDKKWLDSYTQFTKDNDLLLFLDVQMGRREPKDDYAGLEPWLKEDHVHLGIDPEFHMRDNEIPGQEIGQVTAEEVTEAQNWLVDLAGKYGTTRKVLIVHQFHHTMIEDKDKIKPVNNVDLVIDEDGWGPPEMKQETYNVVITQEPIEYNGIKLFYKQDDPIMSAEDVLALDPVPDVVIYQ